VNKLYNSNRRANELIRQNNQHRSSNAFMNEQRVESNESIHQRNLHKAALQL